MIGRPLRSLRRKLPLALTVLLSCKVAAAQTANDNSPARAEQLFSEGLRLMKADHCQDAIPLFAESQKLDTAAATLTNIATCYARLGKTASAYRAYKQAARAAILEHKPELQQRTDQALAALAPTLTRLKIVPLGSSRLPEIRINGQLIEDLREPIPLDPGENIVEATAPDRDPWRRTLRTPSEGALMVVEVPDLPAASHDPHAPPVTAPPETQNPASAPRDSASPINLKPYAIVSAGIGLTGFTVGTILAISAHSKQHDSGTYCDGRYCTQPGIDLRNDASERANLATWSVGIGIVSVATAVVLWTSSSPGTPPPAKLSYQPLLQVSQHSTFIALKGDL